MKRLVQRRLHAQPENRLASARHAAVPPAPGMAVSMLIAAGIMAALMLFACHCMQASELGATEKQIKAALIYNFAKYVEWPVVAPPSPGAPFIIGFSGDNLFDAELAKIIDGRIIGARPVMIQRMVSPDKSTQCQILFISGADKKKELELLESVKGLPVLTVGETDDFLKRGGIIAFVRKENKVRFQVNLKEARRVHLEISSRVLNVADAVVGKSENSK